MIVTFFGKQIVVTNPTLARAILLLALALWLAMAGGVVLLLVKFWIVGIIVGTLYVGIVIGQLHAQIRQIRRSNHFYF